jgi:hypothetical protein
MGEVMRLTHQTVVLLVAVGGGLLLLDAIVMAGVVALTGAARAGRPVTTVLEVVAGLALPALTLLGLGAAYRYVLSRRPRRLLWRLVRRGPRCRYCGDPAPEGEQVCGICAFFVKEAA